MQMSEHTEQRLFLAIKRPRLTRPRMAHGRRLHVGQVWQHNDPRRLRAVRIVDIDDDLRIVTGQNIVTGRLGDIPFSRFTTGREGWSLQQEAR